MTLLGLGSGPVGALGRADGASVAGDAEEPARRDQHRRAEVARTNPSLAIKLTLHPDPAARANVALESEQWGADPIVRAVVRRDRAFVIWTTA